MEIDQKLKENLIVDVEHMCEMDLDEETKQDLMRVFEITIGTHIKELNKTEKKYSSKIDNSLNTKIQNKLIVKDKRIVSRISKNDEVSNLIYNNIEKSLDAIKWFSNL